MRRQRTGQEILGGEKLAPPVERKEIIVADHISDLQWDRLLAGELPAEAREAARAHADRCLACSSRLRELTAERDAFRHRPWPHKRA